MKTTEEIRQIVHATMQTTIEDLKRLVRIPSIANGVLPRERVVEAANETKRIMQDSGLQQVRILEIPGGYPAVYGEMAGPPGAPTVLLYAHYDIVPAEPLDLWESPPFELTARDGRLYGRGAADNKSGVVANAATLRVFGDKPPVNVKVIVEGEEEYGDSLGEYVIRHPDLFAADAIVVADLGNPRIGQPTLITALRGEASLTVEVRTLQGRLHSGNFGGPVPDALIALTKMLATLHDQRGNVAVKEMERKDWQGGAVLEDEFRQVARLLPGIDFIGDGTLASQIWASYAITVIGMDVPSVKESTNALVDVARARISVRIPPGQDSNHALDLLAHHLERVAPWHAQVKISDREVGTGFAAKTDGPAYEAARRAMREVHGKEAGTEGRGGSIPLMSVLAQAIPGAEIILWGAQDLKSVIHAPNESVDQQELERLVFQQALFFQEYSQVNVSAGTKAAQRKAEGSLTAGN